jgi:hypothetical protein
MLLPSSSPADTPRAGSHYIVRGAGVIGLLHIARQGDHLVYNSTLYVNDFCSGAPKGTDPRSQEEWGLWQTGLDPPAPRIDRSGHLSYQRFRPFARPPGGQKRTEPRALVWCAPATTRPSLGLGGV